MKVFLSWSGPLSKSIAEYFKTWLPGVIQQVDDIFISSDISKGEPWFETITKNLDEVDLGLVFITKENRHATWLNFEAGAMVNKFGQSGIRPVLVDMSTGEYDGPMKNLQLAELRNDGDMRKLLDSINEKLDKKLESSVLDATFDMWKAALFANVDRRIQEHQRDSVEEPEVRSDSAKLDEVLELSRSLFSQEGQRREELSSLRRLLSETVQTERSHFMAREREVELEAAARASAILRIVREEGKSTTRAEKRSPEAEELFRVLGEQEAVTRRQEDFLHKYGTLTATRIPGGETGQVVGFSEREGGLMAVDLLMAGSPVPVRLRRGEFELERNLLSRGEYNDI